jgi:hypothetical protein
MISRSRECIDGLDQIGIAGEGMEGGGSIGLEQVSEVEQLCREIWELPPRPLTLQITPDAFDGVQLRT